MTKQSGAAISSKLIPPKLGAKFFIELIISSASLESISKYKIEDLRELAEECNISLKDGSKNKVKSVLYDEINLYKLNV